VSTHDPALMRRALDLALDAVRSGTGGPFGALVVRDGHVVATGQNRVTSTNDPTAHAEIVAIRAACRQLESFHLQGCVLYASCEPCPMCLAAALWARVDAVYYAGTREDAARAGFDDARFHRELAAPSGERSLCMEQTMREAAREAFDAWAAKGDRTPY